MMLGYLANIFLERHFPTVPPELQGMWVGGEALVCTEVTLK